MATRILIRYEKAKTTVFVDVPDETAASAAKRLRELGLNARASSEYVVVKADAGYKGAV